MNTNDLLETNLICTVLEGSHAYGTVIPSSDLDMRGIFCGNPINVRTPFFPVREIEVVEDEDTKYFELNHFMRLLLDQNPNIVQMLWVRNQDIIKSTEAYELLRSRRDNFLSSKIAFTTAGYADSQLKRIKSSKKHVNYTDQLHSLSTVLTKALKVGDIDHTWIKNNCGDQVLDYIKNEK